MAACDSRGRKTYTRKNPPQSVPVAEERIDEVEFSIEHIERQLDHKVPDDFPTVLEYDQWKSMAILALSHYRFEYNFLTSWVEGQKQDAMHGLFASDLAAAVSHMREQILQVYTRAYGGKSVPPDLEIAGRRLDFLGEIYGKLSVFSSEVRRRGSAEGLGKRRLKRLLSPISLIYQEMMDEYSFLKNFVSVSERRRVA